MLPIRGVQAQRPGQLDPKDYTVAWIAPLQIEARAALHLLDERHHGRFPVSRGDDYVFHAGSMCGHKIVIATLPAGQEYGTGSAAALASQVKKFFPNLWFGLLVGVAAGLPDLSRNPQRDIRLGDVLVGLPDGESAGLVAYDLGKETEDGFRPLRFGQALAMTEPIIRSAIGSIQLEAPNDAQVFLPYYETMRNKEHATGTFDDPGQNADNLYLTRSDGTEERIERIPRLKEKRTRVWYGSIGSGEKVIKNARRRNELRDKHDLIGLETEAAGVMNRIPMGVIRGVCDYGDMHKNKEWQPYAAAMAAAYAKAILVEIMPAVDTNRAIIRGDIAGSDTMIAESGTEELAGVGADVLEATRQPCYHIQLSRNNRFTGRVAILNTLEEKLFTQRECRKMALVGLGGVGKTQVALHFAYQVKEKWPDYSVFWVPILSIETFEQAYVEIAKKLGVRKSSDEDDIKEIVCRYLSSDEAGHWLMVVDNADDQEVLFGSGNVSGLGDYLPDSENGMVLLTTRSRQVAGEFAQSDLIDIEQMDHEEASSFLGKSLTQKLLSENEAIVSDVLNYLTYLPLAIAQAAAYINQTKIPLHKYLALLRGAEKDAASVLGREFRDSTRYRSSRNAVATTWLVSFERIRESDEHAVDLLSFLSFIEPKAIPQSILPKLEPEDLEWAIGTLCGYSFLTRRGHSDMFDMHSLVHMATRIWIEKQDRQEQMIKTAIGHLASIFPSEDRANRDLWREYMPHALRVVAKSSEYKTEERVDLCMRIGLCLDKDRRFKEAIACFQEACDWQENHLLETDHNRLALEHSLASTYIDDGRIEEAITILEHVVAVRKKILHEEDQSRLTSEHELARAYLADGRTKEAITIFEHVVTVWKKTLDEEDHYRLASEHSLASTYIDDGRSKEAITILEHVVAVRKKTLDEENQFRLASEHSLARAYLEDGRIKEAITILERVIVVWKKTLDEEDQSRLTSEHELARAYLKDGRTKEAIIILEHVMTVRKKTLHEEDQSRLASEHNLARAYLEDGRTQEAITIFERIVAVRKKTLHEEDQSRLASEHNLARAYLEDGRTQEAITIFERVVAARKKTLDEEDQSRLTSEHNLARAYLHDSQTLRAINILEHVVATESHLFEEDDPVRFISVELLQYAYKHLRMRRKPQSLK